MFRGFGHAVNVFGAVYEGNKVTLLSKNLGDFEVRVYVTHGQPWEHGNVKRLIIAFAI